MYVVLFQILQYSKNQINDGIFNPCIITVNNTDVSSGRGRILSRWKYYIKQSITSYSVKAHSPHCTDAIGLQLYFCKEGV